METLSAMERVNTDNKDRPIEDVVIERAAVFVDPFAEVDEQVGMDFKSFYLFGSLLLDNKKKFIIIAKSMVVSDFPILFLYADII